MRVFTTVHEAIPEMRRDLSKAPKYASHRVQNQDQTGVLMQEAQNYAVTILPQGIPEHPTAIVDLLGEHFELYADEEMRNRVLNWVRLQLAERLSPGSYLVEEAADHYHPMLEHLAEGRHYSYTYRERLYGGMQQVIRTLMQDEHSRRAYWPVFTPQDAIRSGEMTRIPCSLGYFFAIREVEDVPYLHCTYTSRSCDFERFWLTDIFFAYRLQLQVSTELNYHRALFGQSTVKNGSTTHIAYSLHRFTNASEELF